MIKQTWLYLGKSGCIPVKWLYLVKSDCVQAKRLYSGKVVVFVQSGCFRVN